LKVSISQEYNENIQISVLLNPQMDQENLPFHIQVDNLKGTCVEEKEDRNS